MRREEKTMHDWVDSKDRREREALKILTDEQLKAHDIFVDRVWKVSVAIVAIILLSIIIPGIARADTEINIPMMDK